MRDLLDLLAVQEPIPLADLVGLAPAEAVRDAERLGAVEESRLRCGERMVYTAHPLFAERARAALGDDGARRIRTRLLPPAPARARDHASDRLRVAELALGSDTPQTVERDRPPAGEEALRLGDLALAERLGRARWARAGALPARLLLGTHWPGRAVAARPMRCWRPWTRRLCPSRN